MKNTKSRIIEIASELSKELKTLSQTESQEFKKFLRSSLFRSRLEEFQKDHPLALHPARQSLEPIRSSQTLIAMHEYCTKKCN